MDQNAKKTIEKFEWKYIVDVDDKIHPFQVIPSKKEKKEVPQTLYKYYPFNKYSVDALIKGYIYAPHPFELNDLFDCNDSLIDFDDPNIIHRLFRGAFTMSDIKQKLKEKDKNFLKQTQHNFKILFYSTTGIISLTDDFRSILMWSYYTNNSGLVVEFDYSKFGFKYHGPFQMNYQENITPVRVSEGESACGLYQCSLKTNEWMHESEWRLLAEKNKFMKVKGIPIPKEVKPVDRKFEYDPSAIKRIILGNRFFKQSELNQKSKKWHVKKWLSAQSKMKRKLMKYIISNNVPLYIMGRNDDMFTIKDFRAYLNKDGSPGMELVDPIEWNE